MKSCACRLIGIEQELKELLKHSVEDHMLVLWKNWRWNDDDEGSSSRDLAKTSAKTTGVFKNADWIPASQTTRM